MKKRLARVRWEKATEELIAETEAAVEGHEMTKEQARRDIEAADEAIERCRREVEALRVLLKHSRGPTSRRSLAPQPTALPAGTGRPAQPATGRPPTRDLVLDWAASHGGRCAVDEMVTAFVAAGYFDDPQRARNVVIPFLTMPPRGITGERLSRGVYSVRCEAVAEAAS